MTAPALVTAPRLADWASRLNSLIADRRRAPFVWGQNDCCIFAADAVAAVTGVDVAAPWRGTYSTELQAVRLLVSLGGIAAVGAAAGRQVPVALAVAGDVGLVPVGGAMALAVHSGSGWLAPGAAGLVACPADSALRAWKVGVCNG